MKLKYLLIIEAIFSLLTGTGIVLAPATILSLYRLKTDAVGVFMSQTAGALYADLGLLAWLVRNVIGSELRNAITLAYLVYHLISLIVALQAWLMGAFAFELGWVSVVVELFFAAGFAYFRFKNSN